MPTVTWAIPGCWTPQVNLCSSVISFMLWWSSFSAFRSEVSDLSQHRFAFMVIIKHPPDPLILYFVRKRRNTGLPSRIGMILFECFDVFKTDDSHFSQGAEEPNLTLSTGSRGAKFDRCEFRSLCFIRDLCEFRFVCFICGILHYGVIWACCFRLFVPAGNRSLSERGMKCREEITTTCLSFYSVTILRRPQTAVCGYPKEFLLGQKSENNKLK